MAVAGMYELRVKMCACRTYLLTDITNCNAHDADNKASICKDSVNRWIGKFLPDLPTSYKHTLCCHQQIMFLCAKTLR